MQKSTLISRFLITAMLLTTSTHAFQLDKEPVTAYAKVTKSNGTYTVGAKKLVTLMNIHLTSQQKDTLIHNLQNPITYSLAKNDLPSSIDLEMNNVPILDQGQHGTCVTFASTAALDALIGKGDYVSQLCNLELGRYFESNGYFPSGWDGSDGSIVLNQLQSFGFINKTKQTTESCAGVTQYPSDPTDHGAQMTLDQFKLLAENDLDKSGELNWATISLMDVNDRFNQHFKNVEDAKNSLLKIKQSLVKGNRTVFGTLLMSSSACGEISCATFHASNDTWAITDDIKDHPIWIGGHEMVITGYDDNAVAVDINGKKHTGLLILRNSWGDEVGDHGNFYMTYDYFITFAIEAYEILSGSSNKN